MRLFAGLPIFVLLLSSCGAQEEFPVCNTSGHAEEASAISQELTKRKIAHRVEGGTLCHRNGEAEMVAQARGAAYEYFNAIATVLRDDAAEKRITEILNRDKKLYSIVKTTNGSRLLILHSLTPDEVMNNGQYLLRIQREAR